MKTGKNPVPKGDGQKSNLFRPAKMETAFLKMGVMGFQGSGKTHTAALVAIGLYEYIKTKKPVWFFDTEKGSDFHVDRFREAGIPLEVAKSRAHSDILTAIDEAEKHASILIIDSCTHLWDGLVTDYLVKKGRSNLHFDDQLPVKTLWRPFTNKLINSKVHIIACGRASWIWKTDVNEDTGKREFNKEGIKMRAEGEFGYEHDLLVEMDAIRTLEGKAVHLARVFKDRFDIIDGKSFQNPGFKTFLPYIERLNLGGKHVGFDESRNSKALVAGDGKMSGDQYRTVLMEKIKAELTKRFPGQTASEKQGKIQYMQQLCGTASPTELAAKPIDEMERVLSVMDSLALRSLKGSRP